MSLVVGLLCYKKKVYIYISYFNSISKHLVGDLHRVGEINVLSHNLSTQQQKRLISPTLTN